MTPEEHYLEYEDSRTPKLKVLVVGASSGIGVALVPLLQEKHEVYCHAFVNIRNGFVNFWADVKDYNTVVNMLDYLPPIDVLVNLSGVLPLGALHKFPPEEFQYALDVNLTGSYNLMRALLPQMRERKFGRIINMTSVLVSRPEFGTAGYMASKAGIIGLTRGAAIENASHGITVNCVSLGYMEAGMFPRAPIEHQQKVLGMVPLKRPGKVSELHQTIEWLISTEYITGQNIGLNGGLAFE